MKNPDSEEGQRSQVLIVDDDQGVLDGLRRMLRRQRKQWDFTFLASPLEAARAVETTPFDVIITDMRMPDMNGVELLEKVRECRPSCVRIILSGHGELSAIMKSAGPSHQFLSKPCDGEKIITAIERARRMREALTSSQLLETLGQIETLPSLPDIYTELVEALRAEAPLREIGEIIARDIGLSVKMLQLVNSSYFGLAQEITDPGRAVMILGGDTVSSLVLGTKLFEELPPIRFKGCSPDQVLNHCSAVAGAARKLCEVEGVSDVFRSQAVMAAFLHDLGLVTLAAYAPDLLEQTLELQHKEACPLAEAELSVMGATHGQVGGYLTGLWSFPDPVVEAVMYHECPSRCEPKELSPLTLVHVAETLTGGLEAFGGEGVTLDHAHLEALGLLEHLPLWSEALEAAEESE